MHLVLFDIDGTLTQSQSIDAEIYLHSLSEVFGFADVDPDWSSYRHTTDSGILHEIFESRLGRTPAAAEISTFRAHFVDAIAVAAARTPFREILGANQVLSHLTHLPFYCVGLATGGWSDSARCKIRRNRRHAAVALLAAQPAKKGAHQQLRVEAISLGASVLRKGRSHARAIWVQDPPIYFLLSVNAD